MKSTIIKSMMVIAEIGTSHGGNLNKAFSLIDAATDAGADCVKLQWVYADEILHLNTGLVKLPTGDINLYERFRALEVRPEFFEKCKERAKSKGMLFACSPFGLRSLRELVALEPDAIKIASPETNHFPLLYECSKFYGKIPLILSSGVSRLGDIEKAIEALSGKNQNPQVQEFKQSLPPITLLHCVTCYPAPEDEYNVRCVETLRRIFGVPTGISDHSLDPVLVPVLSAMEGGTIVEKHITLSNETEGLDDPVALVPEQFALMVHSLRQSEVIIEKAKHEAAVTGGSEEEATLNAKSEILRQLEFSYTKERIQAVLGNGAKCLAQSERQNYGRTNRSLHFVRTMSAGERIEEGDIAVLRTEKVLTPGISPEFLNEVIGKMLVKNVSSGAGLRFEDLMY